LCLRVDDVDEKPPKPDPTQTQVEQNECGGGGGGGGGSGGCYLVVGGVKQRGLYTWSTRQRAL